MPAKREVYAPDGRAWTVVRRAEGGGVVARLLRSGGWIIEASTEDPPAETRHWRADSRQEANDVLDDVALALRTGAEGPNEPDGDSPSTSGG